MNSYGSLNYQWAFSLIHYFTLQGVTQAVISPGSRSTPLALACENHPDIKTWLQIDERSAGFFALGLAQQTHIPALLICTSGSAVANWLPAVVEANYSYTPLILLSADRPEELQNCGANQSIAQQAIFSSHVRESITLDDASEILLNNNYPQKITQQSFMQSITLKPGPIHINIPFREPLLPKRFTSEDLNYFINKLEEKILAGKKIIIQEEVPDLFISQVRLDLLNQTLNSGQGLIICGGLSIHEQKDFNQSLLQLTQQLNCPVLIDPLSNLRFSSLTHSHFIYNYDHFLKQGQITKKNELKPDWIIRFGQFPVSKNLMIYLQSLNCHTILVSSYGDKLDPIHKAHTQIHCSPRKFCRQLLNTPLQASSNNWINYWQDLEKQSEIKIHQASNSISCSKSNDSLFEGHVINTLLESIPDNSLIFSGNSMAIRDFDTFITHRSSSNKNIDFFANRGASGIDGNLSTFFGLLASQSAILSKTKKQYAIALVGDLTFYHDMNGLLICKQLSAMGLNATIILINNSGGGIFNYLPQQQLESFNKLWITDSGLDFQYSAKLYGLSYTKIENRQELEEQLPVVFSQSGIQLVEVIINQKISIECHKRI